eukprot:jgi/Ulvmu1/9498/UM052_0069.1
MLRRAGVSPDIDASPIPMLQLEWPRHDHRLQKPTMQATRRWRGNLYAQFVICLDSLLMMTEERAGAPSGLLECGRCRNFVGSGQARGYVDLTVGAGMHKTAYNETSWAGAELFKQPFMSGIYEGGWRQSFRGGDSLAQTRSSTSCSTACKTILVLCLLIHAILIQSTWPGAA